MKDSGYLNIVVFVITNMDDKEARAMDFWPNFSKLKQ